MNVREIAELLNGRIEGDPTAEIVRVAKIEDAGKGEITFLANPRYSKFIPTTEASAVIVAHDFEEPEPRGRRTTLIRVADPYLAFLRVMEHFTPRAEPLPPGVHPTAVISPTAKLGQDVRIGAFVYIGDRCVIGDCAVVGHGCVLCEGVSVGHETVLYHNVTVREDCRIGSRVIVHPGVTIGSDGFGFAPKPDGSYDKIPQLGIVVIEDHVEIGANCAIDRGTMGETRIREGVKLDNLIQVAHNVIIGEHTVIAAQTGISGSTRIGRNAMIGGQTGITGHLRIADGTKIGAQSGVHKSIIQTGQTVFGSPALPRREAFRVQGALTQLPDLLSAVRSLRDSVKKLEERLAHLETPGASHDQKP
jgi:UDP-3-O-[3-hydroxymyristoyl] glucosamine N-acyltransferase